MRSLASVGLALCVGYAGAHGGHGMEPGETIQQYAQRHMSTEHHIDSFDLPSFFHLHDLNRDGFWDKEEVEAVYGVHHIYNKKKSKDDEEHQAKADHIVNTVLQVVDKDRDGKISMQEFQDAGLDSLPNFDDAEGHHYDVESEFFLHHEEMYHNTPETQTDESYTHPEDLEHFAHHEEIERKEAEKEAVFQGISVEEALQQHEHDGEPRSPPADAPTPDAGDRVPHDEHGPTPGHPHDDQQVPLKPAVPNYTRAPKGSDPVEKYMNAKQGSGADSEWGQGDGGYRSPKSPSEKMRKNVPYKYKFKRSWGDF